jgi:hypothetical protein
MIGVRGSAESNDVTTIEPFATTSLVTGPQGRGITIAGYRVGLVYLIRFRAAGAVSLLNVTIKPWHYLPCGLAQRCRWE